MIEEGWITKAQAAARLDCDERTIERRARAGRISAKARPGFPTVYRAADVEMLAQAGSQEVQTGILEAGPAAPSNGSGAVASLRSRSTSNDGLLAEVLQAILGALAHGPTGPTGPTNGPTGPTAPTLWVSLDEAAAITGRSRPALRRKIADGTLYAEKDLGWRIRRKDLEQL